MNKKTGNDLPPLLTVVETARYLRISEKAVYEAIKRGQIRAVNFGARRLRIPSAPLVELVGKKP